MPASRLSERRLSRTIELVDRRCKELSAACDNLSSQNSKRSLLHDTKRHLEAVQQRQPPKWSSQLQHAADTAASDNRNNNPTVRPGTADRFAVRHSKQSAHQLTVCSHCGHRESTGDRASGGRRWRQAA